MMNVLETKSAPVAIGPYYQGYEVNGFVFWPDSRDFLRRHCPRRHHRAGRVELSKCGRNSGGRGQLQ